jgi:hypothetical protein
VAIGVVGLMLAGACTSGGGETEPADQALWEDATPPALTKGHTWTNKADLADIDGDADVDILFAEGGNYDSPGKAVRSRIYLNDGSAELTDASQGILGNSFGTARVIKARDLNGDGDIDIVVGNTLETQSRLYLGRGDLKFEDVTSLPQVKASIGDLEVGDVDADGDLDLVLAD